MSDDRVALDRRIRKLEATLEALAARERVIAASGGLLSTGVVYVTAAGTLTTEADFAYIAADNELRTGRVRLAEQATPTTPASGFGLLFSTTGGVPSGVDDAGTVREMVQRATTTWTPAYAGQTTPGTTTYATRTGLYERIGTLVHFTLYAGWSAATGTGNALITGLPFPARNVTNVFYAMSIWYTGITFAAGAGLQGLIRPNTSQIELWYNPASNAATAQIAVEAAGDIAITGVYML
jgi:hypothetical protein